MPTTGKLFLGGTQIGGGDLEWAQVTATSGSTTGTYTDGEITWRWYQWTGNGSVTTTDGLVEVLVVGGGSFPGNGDEATGGRINEGIVRASAGTHTVTIGGAAPINGLSGSTSIGSFAWAGQIGSAYAPQYRTGAGRPGAAGQNPWITNLTGTPVSVAAAATSAGFGNSTRSGVAILRIPV